MRSAQWDGSPRIVAGNGIVHPLGDAERPPEEERKLRRKLVERAKSILQRQTNLSEEEAYKRLQQQSMKTRRSMREIAEAVILSSELS